MITFAAGSSIAAGLSDRPPGWVPWWAQPHDPRVHHLVRRCRGVCATSSRSRRRLMPACRRPGVRRPARGHPVALFGRGAAAFEQSSYADTRRRRRCTSGAARRLGCWGVGDERAGARRGRRGGRARRPRRSWRGRDVSGAHRRPDGRAAGRRRFRRCPALLPSLCGRDPSVLDAAGLTRAALESVAENTSDAQVAPMLWGAVGGDSRGAGVSRRQHAGCDDRSPLATVCPIRLGCSSFRRRRQLHRRPRHRGDGHRVRTGGRGVARREPCAPGARRGTSSQPERGGGGGAFAGALGVRLGGPTQYAHELEIRPTLGDGQPPDVSDLARAVRLSRAVQVLGRVVAVVLSGVGRSGRRVSPRS